MCPAGLRTGWLPRRSQRAAPCGSRVYTVLIYGNDVASGGETEFPLLGLKVAPRRGRALIFGAAALHAGRPLARGEKHVFIKWVHERPWRAG